MTEEGQKQLYSTRTKGDEVLLLNGVPEEQENVDDRLQVKSRDDHCCPTKRDQRRWWWRQLRGTEMVMIVDGGRDEGGR